MNVETISIDDSCESLVLCGGPYNNFKAVEAFLAETNSYPYRFCLGDMGGFGPHPDKTIDQFRDAKVICIQGNYDFSVGNSGEECGCGYINKMDRHYAQVSFDYTFKKTSARNKTWLRNLPPQIVLSWRGQKILLCHGSPVEVNEFVWETETSDRKIAKWLEERGVSGICATHSGLPWIRHTESESGKKGFWMNVGVLGRPAHEGRKSVYYGVIDFKAGEERPTPRLVDLQYDAKPVIEAMRLEGLPEEFCQALERGVWTTCYNILPPEEREIRKRS